jgi:chromosome segregation ATPase
MPQEEIVVQSDRLETTARAVEWLGEQRKVDREQVEQATTEAERLGRIVHDLATKIELLEAERGAQKALGSRIGNLEEGVSSLRETAASLQQALEAAQKRDEHQQLLRTTEAERDRRSVAEVAQLVNDYRRQSDNVQSRLQAIVEDVRRDRAAIEAFPPTIDDLNRQLLSLTSRAQQLEDYRRRADNQVGTLSQSTEQVRDQVGKLDTWQRLADVRWTRLSAELQEQLQAFKHQIDEQAKPIQQLTRQVKQSQEEIGGFAGQVVDLRKRLDETYVSIERLGAQVVSLREAAARVEQVTDGQRRRADEQAATLYRLEEALQRETAANADLLRRIEAQDVRIEEGASYARVIEAQRQRDEAAISVQQQQLRELRTALVGEIAGIREQFAEETRVLGTRLDQATQTQLRQSQRTLAAIQQQAEEWAELARSDARAVRAATSPSEPIS